jgi:uncharacterized protein (DUF1800 family)
MASPMSVFCFRYQLLPALLIGFVLLTSGGMALCQNSNAAANALISPAEAALFLQQATWGPNPAAMAQVQQIGKAAFLDRQFAAPRSVYPEPPDERVNIGPYQRLFYVYGVHGEDQLRQRVAFALSQILVVSGRTLNRAHQMGPYLNLLSGEAFGNYEDLLMRMSLNPAMGRFLDNVNNIKPNPERGTYPNENYAREFLQLFTVGTELLNEDGSVVLDMDGNVIPVYTEETVKHLTNAFTGWIYAPRPGAPMRARNPAYFVEPLVSREVNHDNVSEKVLLNGYVMPTGSNARIDMERAIDNVFHHENVPPFVSLRLIRSLVTSNPSPSYVRDVVQVFKDNGEGVRGDLRAVVRAILLHPEASGAATGAFPSQAKVRGHLLEPVAFILKTMRAMNATVEENNNLNRYANLMGQSVFQPPSVFNYFLLNHVLEDGVAGPEFEIHSAATAVERANFIGAVAEQRTGSGVSYDIEDLVALAENPDVLVEELAIRLTHGSLPTSSKQIIRNFVTGTSNAVFRVRRATYLVANSPQSWVGGAGPGRLNSGRRAPGRRERATNR